MMKPKQTDSLLPFLLILSGGLLLPATAGASEVETSKSLLDLYREGGPVMHIIALCSVATLALGVYCAMSTARRGRYTALIGQYHSINTTCMDALDILERYDYTYGRWPASTKIPVVNPRSGIARFTALMGGECSAARKKPTEGRHSRFA